MLPGSLFHERIQLAAVRWVQGQVTRIMPGMLDVCSEIYWEKCTSRNVTGIYGFSFISHPRRGPQCSRKRSSSHTVDVELYQGQEQLVGSFLELTHYRAGLLLNRAAVGLLVHPVFLCSPATGLLKVKDWETILSFQLILNILATPSLAAERWWLSSGDMANDHSCEARDQMPCFQRSCTLFFQSSPRRSCQSFWLLSRDLKKNILTNAC